MSLPVQLKVLDPRISDTLPQYETAMAAGIDLRACIDSPVELKPGEVNLIPTGVAIYVGDANYAAMILPRSGKGHKEGLVLGNGTGLIDADYQGQLFVSALNRNSVEYKLQEAFGMSALAEQGKSVVIKPMERIAQLIFVPIARAELSVVEEFNDKTLRAEGGFGHTGQAKNKT